MPETEQKQPAFISASHADTPLARELAKALAKAGVRSWLSDEDVRPGDDWQARMEEALRSAPVVVLLLTEPNLRSPSMYFELGAAVADHKLIIPVALGDTSPAEVPTVLRRPQWIRASTPEEAGAEIARVIEATVADAPAT